MKKILVALSILVVAAAAFYVLMERKESREREEAGNRRLLTLDERAVTGVRATLDGVEWGAVRADDGNWFIVEPIRDPADNDAVMNLLRLMNQTQVLETIEEPEPLAAYGLEPARLKIRLQGVDVPELAVGNETPTGNSVFMHVAGRAGVLVAEVDDGSPFLNPDANRLRQRSLTGMPVNDVRQVAIRQERSSVVLEKEGEHWWITAPRRLPASQAALTSLLESLGNAEILGFIDGVEPDDSRFRLGDTALVVDLAGSAGDCRIRLGAGTDAGVRFGRREGRDAVMALSGERLFNLPQDVAAFLDTKLTKANRYKIRWFRYEIAGRVLELRRQQDDEGWLAEDGTILADEAVYPMLVRLLEGRLQGWREGPGVAALQASLEYEQDDGLKDRVEFGPDGSATLDSVPDVVFQARVNLPKIPD